MHNETEVFEIKTHKYRVRDIWLNVAEIGRGEPLVLIHGWTNSWIGWSALAQQLAPYYRLYMLDLPGFGDSDPLPVYSLEILREYVSDFIDQNISTPRAIIGASTGSLVALEVALACQYDSVIFLIGTLLKQKDIAWLVRGLAKILTLSSRSSLAHHAIESIVRHRYSGYLVERFVNAYQFDKHLVDAYNIPGRQKILGKAFVQIGAESLVSFVDEKLQHVDQQTVLIYGTADRYVDSRTAINFVERTHNPHIALHFVAGAGHGPPYERPAETADIIRSCLESVTPIEDGKT